MMLSSLLLAAALSPAPQDPAAAPKPASAVKSEDVSSAASPAAQAHIDAGLAHFKKRHFGPAEIEFRKALEADPKNAAATFYLAYTTYKMCEKKRPFHPDKQKAAELFAKAYALDPTFKPVWAPRTSRVEPPPTKQAAK
jgi:Tfp pilus assembly protein PilF